MEKVLRLYKEIDGVAYLLAEIGAPILAENGIGISTEKSYQLFPNATEQIIITDFEYNANRMGATPSITATVMHKDCLDDFWDESVFAEFNGEKYYVMNTPSSSKDNSDARYKHELELLSEREILNRVYFIDAVQQDETIDKVKSNSTKVIFMGDINELVARLNSSLIYSGLDYRVVVDEGITTENILVSFEDKYFYEALQEGYNLYQIPFYFRDKVIHFGYTDDAIPNVFKYGFDNALLSISKQNTNYKIVTRCTGYGSSDNLPYYYPNATPKGDVKAVVSASNTGLQQSNIRLVNNVLFSEKFNSTDSLKWDWINSSDCISFIDAQMYRIVNEVEGWYSYREHPFQSTLYRSLNWGRELTIRLIYDVKKTCKVFFNINTNIYSATNDIIATAYVNPPRNGEYEIGRYQVDVTIGFMRRPQLGENIKGVGFKFNVSLGVDSQQVKGWRLNDGNSSVDLKIYGLELSNITEDQLVIGDTITQEIGTLIPSTGYLMPPIYRQTSGAEQFYNALNNTYPLPEGEGYYTFENEYNELNPHEMKVSFEDIKPSIVGMTNSLGQRIDKFLDFAWDENDNDEYDEANNKYVHGYFFAKLPKTDGEFGFNLFDHASEQGAMTISMTSGTCGACNFEIGVGEETNKNIVQVNDSGNLKRDANGNVLWENQSPQDRQNDTQNYEVWIALKKEDSTYGTVLPSKKRNLVPSTNDTFVITNINLPQAYVDAAEKKLEDSIIKYISENNVEKFNFDIAFSRIYLAENPNILAMLNENARIIIEYNGQQHTLYVDSYSYKMSSKESLPEISVTLADTINVGSNSLRNAIESVTKDILTSPSGDFLGQANQYYIRKDVEDAAQKTITFEQGLKSNNIESKNFTSGALGSGHKLFTDPDTGQSYCEIDRLYVRMKAYFDTLEIKEVSHIGGELLLTPASMKCSRVEVISGDSSTYRCYFSSDDGEEAIQNQFVVGDLAYCKQFNINSGTYTGVSNRFYWYEVVGVGSDYIDVVEGKCAEGSDIPKEGDTIVSLGNKTDAFRQNAIILSTVGINAPSKILYQGINDYTLVGKAIIEEGFDPDSNQAYQKIYGKTYIGARDESSYISFDPTTNQMKIKAEVEITSGSGFGNLTDAPDMDAINQSIENAQTTADNAQASADAANSAISDLEINVEGAFKDGIISEAEAIAISKYINQVNESFNNTQATYNEVYNNIYLEGTAKTNLKTRYNALVSKKDALLNAINTAIADGKATTEESAAVDTAFNNFNTAISEYQTSVEQANEAIQNKIKSYADAAQIEAQNAKEVADNAQADAAAANADLTNFKSDNIISPVEKTALEQQLADIKSEYSQIISDAGKYSVSTTAYTTAYNSAKAALTKYTAATPEFITVGSDYNNISAYYSARQTILNTIAQKAKDYADSVGANAAQNAKDDLAVKMGYKNYDDLVAAAEAESTIIKGGHINTSLIEAKAITADMMNADGITAKNVSISGEINATSGTFSDVKITGTIRSPFDTADSFYSEYSDNLVIENTKLEPGGMEEEILFSLPDQIAENIGRKITITLTQGYAEGDSGGGYTIWEQGVTTNRLTVRGGETVVLLGYGINNEFKAWIVLSRTRPEEIKTETVTATYFSPVSYDKDRSTNSVWYGLSVVRKGNLYTTYLNGFYGINFKTGSGSMTLDDRGGNLSVSGNISSSGYRVNDGGNIFEGITDTISIREAYRTINIHIKNGIIYKKTYS